MVSTDTANGVPAGPANPWFVVDVERIDATTVARVLRQVRASEGLDQLAYRETEIDALWSLVDMAVRAGMPGARSRSRCCGRRTTRSAPATSTRPSTR
ncbi:hypothetical protein BJF78_11825 [Pseudonocardia sp. CNS-139]|nr:hypothetical protein BJF78_11825 [Pseudonocardia sp. CNS-139]